MITLTTANGVAIPLEEPCPSCTGTGIISKAGGMLTGRCTECNGARKHLSNNGHALLAFLAAYAPAKG